LVALALAAPGCGNKKPEAGAKPKIAVSIFPLYDLTRRVAGDRLDVMLVLPPGKSEHGYDPTPQEIAKLSSAKLGIAVELEMDGWVEGIMRSAGSAKLVRLGEKVPTIPIDVEPIGEGEEHEGEHHEDEHEGEKHDDHDHDKKPAADKAPEPSAAKPEAKPEPEHHDHEKGAPDPHVWLDPDRMVGAVDLIVVELTAIDPAGKDAFTANGEALKTALRTLDGQIQARSKAWTKRTIVTFHGSMSYFAKRYNIRIAAVVEPLAGKEPTAAYIAEVLGAIKRGNAAALFTEPQLDRGPGEVIAKEAGIPLGELDPVGGLPGRESYEALLTWNTEQLEKALK
jgi:ABC-type Zn uptake system ZnuABC Zn-binding protein ZnuA